MTAPTLAETGDRAQHAVNPIEVLVYADQEHLTEGGGFAYVAAAGTPMPALTEDPARCGWRQPDGFRMHIGVGAAQRVDTVSWLGSRGSLPPPIRGAALWVLLTADYPVETQNPHGLLNSVLDSLTEPHALLFRGEAVFPNAPLFEGQVYAPNTRFSQYLGPPCVEEPDDDVVTEIVPVLFHAESSRQLDPHWRGIIVTYQSPAPIFSTLGQKRRRPKRWRILGRN